MVATMKKLHFFDPLTLLYLQLKKKKNFVIVHCEFVWDHFYLKWLDPLAVIYTYRQTHSNEPFHDKSHDSKGIRFT